jgi:signal transduction histidine kinase
MNIRSELGSGTCVTIWLPLSAPVTEQDLTDDPPQSA